MNNRDKLFEEIASLGIPTETCAAIGFGLLLVRTGELVVHRDEWCKPVAPMLFAAMTKHLSRSVLIEMKQEPGTKLQTSVQSLFENDVMAT